MNTAKSRLVIEDYAGVAVVTFSDSSILDTATIDQLGKDLYHLPDNLNKQKIVLDFSNVKFLSSQALGVLLTMQKKVSAIKGSLALAGLRQELMKIFTITSLDKMFKFHPNADEALKSFGIKLG